MQTYNDNFQLSMHMQLQYNSGSSTLHEQSI